MMSPVVFFSHATEFAFCSFSLKLSYFLPSELFKHFLPFSLSFKMIFFLFSLVLRIFLTTIDVSDASDVTHYTILLDFAVRFPCHSTFPPVWAKVNPTYKTIALNGKKHPNFRDDRFSFSNDESIYELRINRVKAADVGTYVCDGSKSVSFSLNVVR